jgi:hypothetical protein
MRFHSCCMCRSFPSAHRWYRPAIFFAARYLFCSSVSLISASWHCFRTVCNCSAHPNKQFILSVLHGADSAIWQIGLLGFCIPFPRIHKRTQNLSKWICPCIQLTGTHSVVWTVQPFCQTQSTVASPSFHLTPTHWSSSQITVLSTDTERSVAFM